MNRTILTGIFCAIAQLSWAQDVVPVTIFPEAPYSSEAISWSAAPVPGTGPAIEVIAMPEAITGVWHTEMEPGEWLVEGFNAEHYFNAIIVVGRDDVTSFEIPAVMGDGVMAALYVCDVEPSCHFSDPATGLQFDLPSGWAADAPYFADIGNGVLADRPSTVFFQESEGEADGGAGWWLNPDAWVPGNGACEAVSIGQLCAPWQDETTDAAFKIIAPSLMFP